MQTNENVLLTDKHVLICFINEKSWLKDRILKEKFCGTILINPFSLPSFTDDQIIYTCGDLDKFDYPLLNNTIQELSWNFTEGDALISADKVPYNVYNVGVYFRNLFKDTGINYFDSVKNAHQFQLLTESNKPGVAYRKGIYLSNVERVTVNDKDELFFNLLRCSSNLQGPTDNFRDIDKHIIKKVNKKCNQMFKENVNLNHVLAQIYENVIINNKEKKAKIKAHSDKTKCMSKNGVIAFCTFYENYENDEFKNFFNVLKRSKIDPYDWYYKNTSVLTKLRFKLKSDVTDSNLEKNFDITLYPNSAFIIPLSTNRLYTHEIIPPKCNIDKIPTRMGYVIRCSKTKAVFTDDQTFIITDDGSRVKLESEDVVDRDCYQELRKTYAKENLTSEVITYANTYFSMNDGDYCSPLY